MGTPINARARAALLAAAVAAGAGLFYLALLVPVDVAATGPPLDSLSDGAPPESPETAAAFEHDFWAQQLSAIPELRGVGPNLAPIAVSTPPPAPTTLALIVPDTADVTAVPEPATLALLSLGGLRLLLRRRGA